MRCDGSQLGSSWVLLCWAQWPCQPRQEVDITGTTGMTTQSMFTAIFTQGFTAVTIAGTIPDTSPVASLQGQPPS